MIAHPQYKGRKLINVAQNGLLFFIHSRPVVDNKVLSIKSKMVDDITCESGIVNPIQMNSKLVDDILITSVVR